MKYFIRKWATGALSDVECEQVQAAYRQHIKSVLPKLPESVAELAQQINLHDGLIRRVIIDQEASQLTLEFRCGDLEVGYFDVDLTYSGVKFETLDLALLVTLARDRRTELLYDEVDVDKNSNFIHRMLFFPEDEFAVTFTDLRIDQSSQPDRFTD